MRDDAVRLPDWNGLKPPTTASLRLLANLEGVGGSLLLCENVESTKDITFSSENAGENEWKKKFDLLTEIQRGCKFESQWFPPDPHRQDGSAEIESSSVAAGQAIGSPQSLGRRLLVIGRSFDLAVKCLASLRSVLARNAMLAVEALVRCMPVAELEAALLQHQSGKSCRIAPQSYMTRFEKLVTALHQRASSVAEKKFIAGAAMESLERVATVSNAFSEAALAVLAKNISYARGSSAVLCSGTITHRVLTALTESGGTCETPYLRRTIPSVSQIALFCLNDKTSECRTAGRGILNLTVQLCQTGEQNITMVHWLQTHWQSVIDRTASAAQRNAFQKETIAIIGASPVFKTAQHQTSQHQTSQRRPPKFIPVSLGVDSNRKNGALSLRQPSPTLPRAAPVGSARRSSSLRTTTGDPRCGTGRPKIPIGGARLATNAPKPPPLPPSRESGNNLQGMVRASHCANRSREMSIRRLLSPGRALFSAAAHDVSMNNNNSKVLADTAPITTHNSITLVQKHRRSSSLCSHKRNLSLTTTATYNGSDIFDGVYERKLPEWIG